MEQSEPSRTDSYTGFVCLVPQSVVTIVRFLDLDSKVLSFSTTRVVVVRPWPLKLSVIPVAIPWPTIFWNGKTIHFPLKWRHACSFSLLLFNVILKILGRTISQEKINKSHAIKKGGNQINQKSNPTYNSHKDTQYI